MVPSREEQRPLWLPMVVMTGPGECAGTPAPCSAHSGAHDAVPGGGHASPLVARPHTQIRCSGAPLGFFVGAPEPQANVLGCSVYIDTIRVSAAPARNEMFRYSLGASSWCFFGPWVRVRGNPGPSVSCDHGSCRRAETAGYIGRPFRPRVGSGDGNEAPM